MTKYIVLLLLLASCSKEIHYPSPFGNKKEGEFKMNAQLPKDNNGYYHYKFNTIREYNYTSIVAEASRITNERYIYNRISVIEGDFDSNAFWIIGDSLAITIPLYNPFKSLYSSPYFTTPLSVRNKTVILSQFKGFIVPVVPTSPIYFKEYDVRMDEYKPNNNNLWTKRVIGPIPKYMIGDTITIHGRVSWECGNYSIQCPQYTHKSDSLKLIID